MGENCQNCPYIAAISERVGKCENSIFNMADKMIALEKSIAVTDERVNQIFSMLTEIKGSIDKIADKMEAIEKRPSDTMGKILTAIFSSLLTVAVIEGIKALTG